MARQMFTGNYGAPLAQVDTRPILAAGQAWGQAFQNLGQVASDVLEKHRQKKETARNTEVLTGIIENNPEFAQSLGIKNPEEQQSLIKDFAKDPARMQMALDAVSHSQQQKMFQQRQREIGMQNLARAEENLAYTLYHTETGTKPDPQALEQVQRLSQELGLDPRVSMFKAQRAARSFEKADVDARLAERDKQTNIAFKEKQIDIMDFNMRGKVLEWAKGTPIGDQIKSYTDQIDQLGGVRYEIDGKMLTLNEIISDDKLLKKVKTGKIQNQALLDSIKVYKSLSEKTVQAGKQHKKRYNVVDPKTGKVVRTEELTLDEALQKQAAQERKQAEKQEKKKSTMTPVAPPYHGQSQGGVNWRTDTGTPPPIPIQFDPTAPLKAIESIGGDVFNLLPEDL